MEIPRHIAIIMDGNGRWAKKRGLPRIFGHRVGVESVREIVRACSSLGVEYLTLYTFSKENWTRPPDEVMTLMSMLRFLLRREVDELNKRNVAIRAIGRIEDLPKDVKKELKRAVEITKNNTGLKLYLALSYGGRTEILDAAKSLAIDYANGKVDLDKLTEEDFWRYLYDPNLPEPDLLIRTSGEQRISNFLLWQTAYTELYIIPTLWPDFRRKHLIEAIKEYNRRERRFGGLPK